MPIAVFGNKVFEVTDRKIYTIENMIYGASLNTEKQDAAGKKPSTYNKGPNLSTFGFSLKLDASKGINPRREIQEWEEILEAGVAYLFILGERPLGKNKFLLIEVQTSEPIIDNAGNMLFAKLDLKFDEYVRPGSVQSSNQGSNAPGIDSGGSPVGIEPVDKSGLKRTNLTMSKEVFNQFKANTDTQVVSRSIFDEFKGEA